MPLMDVQRYATQRGRYLARTTDLRKPEAKAIAYAEQGFSINGISKKLDVSESTVKDYLERAMAQYGLEIAETLLPDEEPPDYEKVGPGYHRNLKNTQDKEEWVKLVDRHRDKLPQEWVHNVLGPAKNDGIKPLDVQG